LSVLFQVQNNSSSIIISVSISFYLTIETNR